MHRSFIPLVIFLLFAGCATTSRLPMTEARPPSLSLLSVSPDPGFKRGIDTLVADTLFPPSNLGVKIVSAKTGQVLYALNADMLFNPASNEKLITCVTALTRLGSKFPLRTRVLMDTARSILWLQGFGDPLLSSEDLDSLSGLAGPSVPNSSAWTVSAGVRYFDDLYWGAGWAWDEEPAAYGMFISPLMLDNNTISVQVTPGEKAGRPPAVALKPVTEYVSVENTAVTLADTPVTSRLQISRKWMERSNVLTIQGQILLASRPVTDHLSLWKPELYAATSFAEKLKAKGIPIAGVVADTIQPSGVLIAEFMHTLDTVVTFMNKVSDNLSAEALLKVVSAESGQERGSAETGIPLVRQLLGGWGIDTLRTSTADGSGLSRYNLTTPSAMVRVLQQMWKDTVNFPTFYHSLPIAGVDGTIGTRMKGTPAEGNLRAKTGSLSAVSALSGYVQTAAGEPLIFSILMQNYSGSARLYRQVQDRIGAFLAGWKR
jgi:serine-type D-Ala-D-Ala carboxypeptidase/endopeptidase (penicillin-binding protein 4)